jgi:hypothetical protein
MVRVAVVQGNRTLQERLSAPFNGFEDRAGHQIQAHYRGGLQQGELGL